MSPEIIGKLIPTVTLFFLAIIEAFGGLYFNDKRTKNDFTIEIISLAILPTLIQPSIFLIVFWIMATFFSSFDNILLDVVYEASKMFCLYEKIYATNIASYRQKLKRQLFESK